MKENEEVFSTKIRAGKRTYFFDVRPTRSNDYYLTITESKRRFDGKGYDKHKIFLYKEDFNKFIISLNEAIDYVKTELMPDYDYDEFSRLDYDDDDYTASSPKKEVLEEKVESEETKESTGDGTEEFSTSWEE
jgi:hypothetical protein